MVSAQKLRPECRFSVRDAEILCALVSECKQPSNASGDRILGHRRISVRSELLQAGLAVLKAKSTSDNEMVGDFIAEDLHCPLHARSSCDSRAG